MFGIPAHVLVSSCGVRRGEAWLAEQGRRAAEKTYTQARLRVERERFPEGTRMVHRFSHTQPRLVSCVQCRHELRGHC